MAVACTHARKWTRCVKLFLLHVNIHYRVSMTAKREQTTNLDKMTQPADVSQSLLLATLVLA